jgi:hypothetical protein
MHQYYLITILDKSIKDLNTNSEILRNSMIPLYVLKRAIDLQVATEHEDYENAARLKKRVR